MRTAGRWAGYAIVVVATVLALDHFCWRPFVANIRIRELDNSTKTALQVSNRIEMRVRARQNIEVAERLRHRFGDDVEILMPLAANLRIVSRNQDAAEVYRTALLHARRPEILRNLAEVQLELGQRDEAIENYVLVARFSPHVLQLIIDPAIVAIVRSRAKIH